jgi:hypothetical protein
MSVTKGPNNRLTRQIMYTVNHDLEKNQKILEDFLLLMKMEKKEK